MNALLTGHLAVGVALAALLALGATAGALPDDSHRSAVPVSVRDNPASYRPIYVVRGNSWRTGGSSGGGGGFGFGK